MEGPRYQADLARRRQFAVDPANRLVVTALEETWNARLQELEEACRSHTVLRDTSESEMSATQLRKVQDLAEEFAVVWNAPQTENRTASGFSAFSS